MGEDLNVVGGRLFLWDIEVPNNTGFSCICAFVLIYAQFLKVY